MPKRNVTREIIEALFDCPKLTPWQRGFIASIKDRHSDGHMLTEAQGRTLYSIRYQQREHLDANLPGLAQGRACFASYQ